MALQEPQEQFESDMADSKEEETSMDSPLSESDTFASSDESESVDVPSTEETAPSITLEDDDLPVPAKTKSTSSAPASSDELPPTETPEGPAWYVIHCYSGYENKVRHNLEQRIETMGMKDRIFDVVIPTQEEIEVK